MPGPRLHRRQSEPLRVAAVTTPELPPVALRVATPPQPSRSFQIVGDITTPAGCGRESLPLRGDAAMMLGSPETAEAVHGARVLP